MQANGAIDGKPISITANATSQSGRTSIPKLAVEVGPNKLQGRLELSPSFEPSGTLNFDLPDLSLLAALAGQKADGDLKELGRSLQRQWQDRSEGQRQRQRHPP